MSRHPERAQDYLEHILDALERIQEYTAGRSEAAFMADRMLQDAVLRNLGIVGEAARRMLTDAPEYAANHPEIPFAQINATRNRIIHAYEEMDLKIVWNLIQFDGAGLQPMIVAALQQFEAK